MIDNGNGTRSGHQGQLLANTRRILAGIPLLLEKDDSLLAANRRLLEIFQTPPK
ncbi:hypothetical protein [Metabacillus sp. cB07]|uniref:hypothetical protein n=1 Tax=Metabacillus sp. cB07 TaxID=2806989 RepID=UPI00193A5054|nr:hypothetical protein [Metabacillus sp. cB07]